MKKIYKHLLLLLLGVVQIQLYAQQNIAPLATASASTCNTGACSTLNDLQFGTCGTQLMWVTTTTPPSTTPGVEWIQFDWTSPKSLNKFIIHHAQNNTRFMAGATIQSWNGSAWVTVSTFANLVLACSSTVNFPLVTTSRLRLTAFTMAGTQLSNPNFREIEIFGPNVNNDAAVTSLTTFNTCTYTQKIDAVVTNYGKKRLDSFRLNWSVNNIAQTTQYITSSLTTGQFNTYSLSAAYTFAPNTLYTVRAWTTLPNGQLDSVQGNDLFLSTVDFMGSPADPTVTSYTQCGRGYPLLSAATTNPADSVFWYDAAIGGNMLGLGKNILGPYTISTKTFYAQTAKLSKNVKFGTVGTTGVNVRQTEPYGGMQTITNNKTILMDSIQFRLWYATPTNCGYQLYYRVGAHTAFTTTSTGWIKLSEGVATFAVIGGVNYGRVSANKLNLPAGTYSFYLTTDLDFGAGNSLYSLSAGPGAVNPDISILTGGNIIIGKFGSTQTLTYQPELIYVYKNQCVSVNRTSMTVTVKPRPIGANVIKGSPYQGNFRLGVPTNPDVVEIGKTISYQLTPPSGYQNIDYGSTWQLTNVQAKTRFNVLVPPTDYQVNLPTAGANANLVFKPKTVWRDSFITFTVQFFDMGPYFCDSSVQRTVYVAPTPRPNFSFPASICLGESTVFENLTTIHSGVCSYMWYFDDGDSSDLNSPVHDFKNQGSYKVKLVARSYQWDIYHDTTIQVNIGDVPTVDFKVTNACFGSTVKFSNYTFIGNGTLTYSWDFGDASTKLTSTNSQRLYQQPGPYAVTLTASANGCSASKTKGAYQFAKPKANFIQQTGNCLNDLFTFTNASTISLGHFGNKWFFDDAGNIATDKNPEYTFTSPGNKSVKLTVISEFGCQDSVIVLVQVKQIPTTDFNYPFACDRTATAFNNTTNLNGQQLLMYNWDFGNGMSSTATAPSVNWPNVGLRNVTLKTSLFNGCSSQITKSVNVGVQPKADFEFQEQCSGEEVTFANLSTFSNGKVEYQWDFGDNAKTQVPSPQHLFNSGITTQSFNVQLKASIVDGCADSIIKIVTIQAVPTTCDFNYARTWQGSSRNYQFTPTGGSLTGITYTWVLGDGNRISSNSAGVNYTYKGDLKYCVTMVAENQGACQCSSTKCLTITTGLEQIDMNALISIYPNPNAGIFTINFAVDVESMEVDVYSLTGELLHSVILNGNSGLIDISEFASGMYLVKVKTNETLSTQMITISR